MKSLRIALLALGLTLTCQPAAARPGAGPDDEKVRISDLRLARTPDAAQGSVIFPEDTRELFVSFAYAGGTSEPVTFIVIGPGGVEAARLTGRYRGDGTATLKISGRRRSTRPCVPDRPTRATPRRKPSARASTF